MPLTVAADGTLTPAVHWLQGAPRGRALSFASHDCALMCALFALGAIAPRQARCFACSQCTSAVPHPSAPSPATLDQDAPPPTRSAASCAAQHPEDSATSVAALYPAGTQRASPTPPRRPRRGHDAVEPRGQLWEVVACRVVGIVGRVGQHEPHGRSGHRPWGDAPVQHSRSREGGGGREKWRPDVTRSGCGPRLAAAARRDGGARASIP